MSNTQKVIDGMAEFHSDLIAAIRPIAKSVIETGQRIYDTMYAAYIADGAIYGESQEGMLRWMEELREIARLCSEAQRLEDHHAMLRRFKEATNKAS